MDFFEIKVEDRETRGKCPARVLRTEGKIPGVVYGPGSEAVAVAVVAKDIELAKKASKTIQVFAKIVFPNGESKNVMIKELQTDPSSNVFLHVDFYEVSEDRKIISRVPVLTTGKSAGVEVGGILQVIRRTLDVKCYPQDVLASIDLDITDLKIGDSIHVEEVKLEGGVEVIHDVNFTVVTIVPPKGMVVASDDEEEEAAE